ncbi:MAG: filamentous hemagglutinin, partial [Pseudomonadota bacterium]|nr:filamentous hemagglutinin [Pseudomonadota bacterium]
IDIASSTHSSENKEGGDFSRTNIDRVAGLYVQNPGGTLQLAAAGDITLLAAHLINTAPTAAGLEAGSGDGVVAGSTRIDAGGNLTLGTVAVEEKNHAAQQILLGDTGGKGYRNESGSRREIGTRIESQGDVTLVAGGTLAARAAEVTSTQGDILAGANDIVLEAGEASSYSDISQQKKRSGFLSSKSKRQRDAFEDTSAVASTFSGENVALIADRDVQIKGSNVAATKDVTLIAGRDLAIEAAQESHNETHEKRTTQSGVFGSGGVGFTLGSRMNSSDQQTEATTAAKSTVGSVEGNVTLLAGEKYRQVGSDVIAVQGDIDIAAKQVDIKEARETSRTTTETRSKQSGLTIAITSPVITAIQTAKQMSEAAKDTSDSRMKALAAASTGLAGYNAANAIAEAGSVTGGVNLVISIGGSKSSSQTTQTSDTAAVSNLSAGRDIRIEASGDGKNSDAPKEAPSGGITLQGTQANAARNLALAADDEIKLLAATNTANQKSKNQNASGSVGISIGTNTGFTVGASAGRGKADGDDLVHTNTRIEAAETLTLQSGGDTTLQGAVAKGEKVIAEIGGPSTGSGQANLKIESLQDTSTYDSKQKSLGGSITIGAGVSGNVSASSSKVKSDYASVTEQSGIRAGDGGFDVKVKGDTDLKGGAITSTQEAINENRNRFETGGQLTLSDIQNKAEYSAKSVSVNIGAGQDNSGKLTPGGTSAGFGKDGGKAESMTLAAISGVAGNTGARTGDAETGIQKIFDQEKVQKEIEAQVKITQTFGQLASKAVGDYAQTKLKEARALRDQGREQEAKDIESQWGANGTLRLAAHTLIGGLTGGASGAAGAAAGTLTAPAVADALAKAGINGVLATALTAAASTAAGAAVGGTAGGGAALNEVANNFLSHEESSRRLRLKAEKTACRDDACHTEKQREIDRLDQIDVWRDQQIEQACRVPSSAGCQGWTTAIQVAAKSYYGKSTDIYLDTAERASVQNKAFEYKQAADNPFLHGVGKGLLKLTPPGLLVGAVGGIGAAVQGIVEKGATQALIDAANALADFPADLKVRLNSADPTIRGEALVDAVALGTTGAAITAGASKVALDSAQKAAVSRALAKAEEEVVAKAKVDLNLYRDWPIASDMVQHRINQLSARATHNPEANMVVLGKYVENSASSYEQVAKAQGATYFELPGTSWSEAVTQLGVDKMWSVNKKFLDDQMARDKGFVFTLDPRTVAADSFTAKEYSHLLHNGYRLIEEAGGTYRAIKK